MSLFSQPPHSVIHKIHLKKVIITILKFLTFTKKQPNTQDLVTILFLEYIMLILKICIRFSSYSVIGEYSNFKTCVTLFQRSKHIQISLAPRNSLPEYKYKNQHHKRSHMGRSLTL